MAGNLFGPAIAPATPVGAAAPSPMNLAMNPQAQATNQQPQSNVIYVDGMQEVLDHPAGPNEHLFFPEKNSYTIWVRDTDAKGEIKNPLKKLNYTVEEVAFGPEANFVTKQEFQKLFDAVMSTNNAVNKLRQELGGEPVESAV